MPSFARRLTSLRVDSCDLDTAPKFGNVSFATHRGPSLSLSLSLSVYCYLTPQQRLGAHLFSGSSAHPPYASDEIEKATGGAPALFARGCGADQNPTPRGPKFDLAGQHGHMMAVAVAVAATGAALTGPFTFASGIEGRLMMEVHRRAQY
jgi:hypothetical protein